MLHCVNALLQNSDKHLPLMAELLGINEDQIRMWLCNKKVVSATEVITKPLTVTQVSDVTPFNKDKQD